VQITGLDVCPLTGATVDGGWPQGHEPQEDLHTLIVIHTDGDINGYGSCFTSGKMVAGAAELLWPLLKGQSVVEPERVSESLHQATFWQGRGGSVTHAISGIDIALWDIMGKVCQQPVSRLLGGNYRDKVKAYGSILFDEPKALAENLTSVVDRGFKAIKMGWRPFGRRDAAFDELLVKTARDTVGDDIELMVSVDGQRWERPFRDEYFLARSEKGKFDSMSIWSSTMPVVLKDEIRFYYGAYNFAPRGGIEVDESEKSGIGMATIPLDRFGGVLPLA